MSNNFNSKNVKLKFNSDHSHDFDWVFYCSHYYDLKKSGINTEKLALKHYMVHGKKEGRIINKSMLKHKEFVVDRGNELLNENDISFNGHLLKEIGEIGDENLFLDKGFPIFNYKQKIYSYDIV